MIGRNVSGKEIVMASLEWRNQNVYDNVWHPHAMMKSMGMMR